MEKGQSSIPEEEDDSVDLSQFKLGSSDEEKAGARSDYQEVRICDVNSNSDMSHQQKNLLN